MPAATGPIHARPPHAAGKPALPAYMRCSVLLAAGWNEDFDLDYGLPPFRTIRWPDPAVPDLNVWALGIANAAAQAAAPAVVVAQGFACLATMRAAALRPGAVAGALLMAPADPAHYGLEERLAQTVPDFPSVLLPGEGPDALRADEAWIWALRWDSQFASLGPARNGEGHGGLVLLEQLCRRVLA
jgi:predicted alpha/beta hydrolase family esterase